MGGKGGKYGPGARGGGRKGGGGKRPPKKPYLTGPLKRPPDSSSYTELTKYWHNIKNFRLGDRHEKWVGYWLRAARGEKNVASQITIHALKPDGTIDWSNKAVLDDVVHDPKTGTIELHDAKRNKTSNKTRIKQQRAFEAIEQHGGIVTSNKPGQPDWIKHETQILKGTPVTKQYEGSGSLEKLKDDARKAGATVPDTLPHESAKGRPTGKQSRSTSNRATTADPDLPPAKNAPKPKTNATGFTKKAGSEAVSDISTRSGRLASKGAKIASKLRIGFGADLVITLATQMMLYILESRLQAVNNEGIRRAYANSVFRGMKEKTTGKTLEQLAAETIYSVQQGTFEKTAKHVVHSDGVVNDYSGKYLYLDYKYDVLMEQQAKDISDAVVMILKGFEFVEVYQDLVPDGFVSVGVYDRPLSENSQMTMKRLKPKNDVVRYKYRHRLLLWDPVVKLHYWHIWADHVKAANELWNTVYKMNGADQRWAIVYRVAATKLIKKYRFREAKSVLIGEHKMAEHFPDIPTGKARVFDMMIKLLDEGDAYIAMRRKWTVDRKALLVMYLGTDPFSARRKQLQREKNKAVRERLERLRKQSHLPPPGVARSHVLRYNDSDSGFFKIIIWSFDRQVFRFVPQKNLVLLGGTIQRLRKVLKF